jgi:hypothetical protein
MEKTICNIFLLILPAYLLGQVYSVEKGTKTFDAGIGLGIYNTFIEDKSTGDDTTSRAGAIVYPLDFEYGVSPRFGAGGMVSYSNYIEDDSSSETADGIDLAAKGNFHMLNRKHIDIFGNLIVGFSRFKLVGHDKNNTVLKGGGMTWGLGVTSRFLLGYHFGLYLNLGYGGYSYSNLHLTDNLGQSVYYRLRLSGTQVGTGIVIRF